MADHGTEPDPDAEASVFVSYSRKDREQAQRISDRLRDRHFGVFRDTEDILPTEEWRGRLEQLIADADTIVFLLSPHSATSDVCAWEIELAHSLQKRIAPIVIAETDSADIPPLLARLNFIFCTERDRFEDAVESLISALNTDIEWIREHTRLAGLAGRWDKAERPGRLLLTGQDIADAENWRDSHPAEAPQVTATQAAFVGESRRAAGRRQRYWVGGSLGIAAATLALAVFAWFQSVEADRQRTSAETNAARAEKEAQAAIDSRNQALITESRFLAALSEDLSAAGNHADAMALALRALPSDEALSDRPLVDSAAAALRTAWYGNRVTRIDRALHPDGISHAKQSVSLDTLLTLDDSEVVRIFRLPDLELVARFDNVDPSDYDMRADGRMFVYRDEEDGLLRIHELPSGDLLREIPRGYYQTDRPYLSPDGRVLVTRPSYTQAVVWPLETEGEPHDFGNRDGIGWGTVFTPDGKFVIAGRGEEMLTAAAVGRDGPYHVFEGYSEEITVIAASPDSKLILSGTDKGAVFIMATETGDTFPVPVGHDDRIDVAAFDPKTELAATGSRDGSVRLWSVGRGDVDVILAGHEHGARHIAFAPDGSSILTADGAGTVRHWRVPGGKLIHVHNLGGDLVQGIGFMPTGDSVYAATRRGEIRTWRATPPNGQRGIEGHADRIVEAEFSPDGNQVATAGADGVARLWSSADGTLAAELDGHDRWVSDVNFLAGSGHLVTGSFDEKARIWDAATGDLEFTLTSQSFVDFVVPSPDGKRFALNNKSKVHVWDIAGSRTAATMEGHTDDISAIAFSPDGRHIATASDDGTARLWNAEDGSEIRILSSVEPGIYQSMFVRFSPDGTLAAVGSDTGRAEVVDVSSGEPVIRLPDSNRQISDAAFAPSGDAIVFRGSEAFGLRFVDLATGKTVWSRELGGGARGNLAFSPDGHVIAISNGEGSVELIRASDGVRLAGMPGGFRPVARIRFAPSGSDLLSAHADGSAHIWPMPPDLPDLVRASRATIDALDPLDRRKLCSYFQVGENDCREAGLQ